MKTLVEIEQYPRDIPVPVVGNRVKFPRRHLLHGRRENRVMWARKQKKSRDRATGHDSGAAFCCTPNQQYNTTAHPKNQGGAVV